MLAVYGDETSVTVTLPIVKTTLFTVPVKNKKTGGVAVAVTAIGFPAI
jgi:hypothetical protein